MATIKSYTDLNQSRKLAAILPIESADMCYPKDAFEYHYDKEPVCHYSGIGLAHPCWSLVALLDVLPDRTCVYKKTYKDGRVKYQGIMDGSKDLILKDNPVDACVAMIEKLYELKML